MGNRSRPCSPRPRRGGPVVDRELHTRARTDLAWPQDGALDAGIVEYAARLGRGTLLSSGEGVGGADGTPVGSGASDDEPVSLGGGRTALTYDRALAAVLAQDGLDAAPPRTRAYGCASGCSPRR
ncbi:hypothetical protein NKH77_31310 [Streptomyces sp. M19]